MSRLTWEFTLSVALLSGASRVDNAGPEWDELVPTIFSDVRFHKANGSRRRWQVKIDGARAGIVVAWRPDERDNFALNKADLDRLLGLKQDGSFNAAFVVTATVTGSFDAGNFARVYVSHRDAEQLAENLKSARLRKGEHGDYWLLQESCSPSETANNDDIPF